MTVVPGIPGMPGMPGGPCGPGGPGGPWGPLGPGGPAFLPGKHKDRHHPGLWGGKWEVGDGSLLAQDSQGGCPTAPHREDNAASGAGPVSTLQAPSCWELHSNKARGLSGASQGMEAQGSSSHSSGHPALGMGSAHKSHALGLVTSLRTWDDLWMQSGYSHSTFQCTQPQLGCSGPHEPLCSCSICWVSMESRDHLSYLLHRIRIGR